MAPSILSCIWLQVDFVACSISKRQEGSISRSRSQTVICMWCGCTPDKPFMLQGGMTLESLWLPARVRAIKWAPQNDMLAHPAVKAFVTHGGSNSLYEVSGTQGLAGQYASLQAGARTACELPMHSVCWPFKHCSVSWPGNHLSFYIKLPCYPCIPSRDHMIDGTPWVKILMGLSTLSSVAVKPTTHL